MGKKNMFFFTLYFLEFKNRIKLVMSGLLFVIALFIAYKETLLYILIKPTISSLSLISRSYLICTNITDGFTTYWNIIMILYLHYVLFFLFYNAYFFLYQDCIIKKKKFLVLLFYKLFTTNKLEFFF